MRVKRYIVDTMPEAMQHIRNELGGDAVILSSKEIKIGGFMGIFKKKKIEVIAAVEKDEKSKPKTNKAVTPIAPVPRKIIPQAYKQVSSTQSQSQVKQETDFDVARELKPPEKPSDREQAAVDFAAALAQAASSVSDNKQDEYSGQSPLRTDEQERSERLESAAFENEAALKHGTNTIAEQKMLDELREMKECIARLSRQSHDQQELPSTLESLRNQFERQGLSETLSERFLISAADQWTESGKTLSDELMTNSVQAQIDSFLEGRFGGGIQRDTRIVYVAGPTGVGKTTTIAKLAAEQLFRYQRKVGFITSDTYRISAVEQLRTYSSILNVPLEVVQSPGDMKRAMHRLEDCDLILMDTAGRNYRNELLVSELQSLLTASDQSETYLVLSLTSKSSDMLEITDHFSKFGLDKVIFTKMDETGGYGPLFNLLESYPLKLSYMTNGQNVPDDLLMPDTEMLSGMLLGESRS